MGEAALARDIVGGVGGSAGSNLVSQLSVVDTWGVEVGRRREGNRRSEMEELERAKRANKFTYLHDSLSILVSSKI